ncbi:MAG: hypothetical protein ACKO23_19370, partial [Gemmataceae bacterium]
TRQERQLKYVLRLEAVLLGCALPAVFFPHSWMSSVHESLGMGPLPGGPIMDYLTRSLSLLYFALAPLIWIMAGDPARYLPLLRWLGWGGVLFSVLLLGIDLQAGMPLPWTVSEFAIVFLLSLWIGILAEMLRVSPGRIGKTLP